MVALQTHTTSPGIVLPGLLYITELVLIPFISTHQVTYVIRVWVDLANKQIYLVDLIFYLRSGATTALPSSRVICDLSGNGVWDDRVSYDPDKN
jgi:hypothetical protein